MSYWGRYKRRLAKALASTAVVEAAMLGSDVADAVRARAPDELIGAFEPDERTPPEMTFDISYAGPAVTGVGAPQGPADDWVATLPPGVLDDL